LAGLTIDRSALIKQPGKSARTVKSGKVSLNRSAWTSQPGQDLLGRSAAMGQRGKVSRYRSAC
jgi:hypothetical protein